LAAGYIGIVGDWEDIRADAVEGAGAEASDAGQVVEVSEVAVLLALGDEPLGQDIANAGELDQLGPVSSVDVDLEFGNQRGRAVDVHQPAAMTAVAPPGGGQQGQGAGQEGGQGALVAWPEQVPGVVRAWVGHFVLRASWRKGAGRRTKREL
jgi:hypothetical protein